MRNAISLFNEFLKQIFSTSLETYGSEVALIILAGFTVVILVIVFKKGKN